ncbi:MAG: Gfo/Idh/MocA family oxidoreductase, partial [Candidatus Omnitrophica bacterium]|nr:Gfo/Idh/MocA family oxidoreductase [Candidatus Omnitrophota bacterium]
MPENHLSRRNFLAATAAATAALSVDGAEAAYKKKGEKLIKVKPRKVSPNEKLNCAAIGAGGKGNSDIAACEGENVVALCDADWDRAAESFQRFPNARKFKDYRVMLEEMPEIDAVTVSTPDHTHAPAAYMAMKMGKHVYVQKPLTHTVAEARLLRDTARECGVATQMGNQGHAEDGVRNLYEMVWSGAIGQVKEVHIWTSRPVWPQGI